MPAIAAVRCSPSASADGSLKLPDSEVAAVEAGAGDGVAGGCELVVDGAAWGAAGAAGVETGFAGVDGSAGFDGAAFGCHVLAPTLSSHPS